MQLRFSFRDIGQSFSGRKRNNDLSTKFERDYKKEPDGPSPAKFLSEALQEVNSSITDALTTGVYCELTYKDTENDMTQGMIKYYELSQIFRYMADRFDSKKALNQNPRKDRVALDVYESKKDAQLHLDVRRTRQDGHYFEITAMFKTTKLKRPSR